MREVKPGDLAAERVLVVGAHPDDAEFFAGGTLVRLIEEGASATLVVCTDGARGARGRDDVAALRHAEQDAAALELGAQDVVRLERPDGGLVCDGALRADLVRQIRRVQPHLVLTHDPTTLWTRHGSRAYLGHTDHRAAGQATFDAIYPGSANPNFFPEQLDEDGVELWEPPHLWLFDTASPDIRVDVTETLERKLEALRRHESQEASAGGLVEAARRVAERAGDPGRPAELFLALRLRRAE